MRATFTIKHKAVSLDGTETQRLVSNLSSNCGTAIADHETALKRTLAFRESWTLTLPMVIYAFGPTLNAVAICSRAAPEQIDVHIETTRTDICDVCKKVASRMAKALKPHKPRFEITLAENDGKETGIKATSLTFLDLLGKQFKEYKIIPALITLAAGFGTFYFLGKTLEASIIAAAASFAMLFAFIILSCIFRAARKSQLSWTFEEPN